ncbi:MAG TPA: DUF881 domain-containing protein [Dermatophilaceae bacterium]|nr:DUF881 domain-containing protein [Dermatophilaceae bacterium]
MSTPTRTRPDASMTLLTEMMERPLDPGYAAAARRREAAGLPPSAGLRSPLLVGCAVMVGLLFAVSALALRVPATSAVQAKNDLIAQIEARRAQVDAQSARIAALRQEIDAISARQLQLVQAGGLAERVAQAEQAAGALAVTGPGLRLTVDDAPSAGSGGAGGPDDQGKVISADLQLVVNGLWQAGAEAVAVNGHRLTSRSAIRFAGEAILVDYRPLTRPYLIEAIGDPTALPAAFAATEGGAYLQSLKSNFGIVADVAEASRLTLPGQPSAVLRSAHPATTPSTAPATASPGRPVSTPTTTGGTP